MQSNYKGVKTLLTTCTYLLVLLTVPVFTDSGRAGAQPTDSAPIEESDVAPVHGERKHLKRVLRERRFSADAATSPAGIADVDRPMRRRNFAGAGVAGRGMGRNMNRDMGSAMGRATLDLSQLNLTEEQKSRITALRSKDKGVGKEIMQSIKSKRAEMREMIFDPSFTTAQIKAKRHELRNLLDGLDANKLDDLLAIRAILTPDQVKRLRPGGSGIADAAAPEQKQ